MRKIKYLFIIMALFTFGFVLQVYANPMEHPEDYINVTKTGETEHGNYTLQAEDINPNNINADNGVQKTNYIARIVLSVDPGYYIENMTVKFNEQDLALGFIAGHESGAFFRRYDFSPQESLYEFFVPENANADNKVEIVINYLQKASVNISYKNYEGEQYDNGDIFEIDNYGDEHVLVENYRDGDIVLTEDAVANGTLLKLEFTEDTYAYFKGNEGSQIHAEAPYRKNNQEEESLFTGSDACDDEGHFCYVVVTKDFNLASIGRLIFGYNDIKIYVPGYVGFRAEGDVRNFNDSNLTFGFNESNLEVSIEELFYGTKKLFLYKNTPNPIVNDANSANNCGSVGDFDNVSGEGYGYTVSYSNNTVTVNINSYYQDFMTLELALTKNNQNIFNDNVRINLNRFAFSGGLLEVDSIGRNCQEPNNGNTCSQGRYYSIEYRGVLSSFYVDDDVEEKEFNSIMVVNSMDDNSINLSEWNQGERAFERNKDFTPHVLALFYDNNDMIVDTKTFDLNEDILDEGYQTAETFNNVFGTFTLNTPVNKDYIRFDNSHRIPIKDLDYFNGIDNASIMHPIVLIGKDEAEEKNVEKIALFLINGEIEENEIPSLTYGTGEGKIVQIRHEDNGGND